MDDRFVVEPTDSAVVAAWRAGGLPAKVAAAKQELADCRACPRDCGVNRLAGEEGICRVGRWAHVTSAFAHLGEEDCLRGRRGSGTIFFGSCNLRCAFCQNWDISQLPAGAECSDEQLATLMLDLQELECHNINLVTPEHVVPQVVEALAIAVPEGLRIPVVYNTSAYDAPVSLRLMEGLVDIYMPDFKFWEPATARRLARAGDYPASARETIVEMHRQVGDLVFDAEGLAVRGLLVRHLVMPGQTDEAASVFAWLAERVSRDTYVNIMAQYRPEHRVPMSPELADINRRPTPAEISAAYQAARDVGLHRFDERRF
jgi:putative pyruvate formate lyase activating enzyme